MGADDGDEDGRERTRAHSRQQPKRPAQVALRLAAVYSHRPPFFCRFFLLVERSPVRIAERTLRAKLIGDQDQDLVGGSREATGAPLNPPLSPRLPSSFWQQVRSNAVDSQHGPLRASACLGVQPRERQRGIRACVRVTPRRTWLLCRRHLLLLTTWLQRRRARSVASSAASARAPGSP